MNSKSFEIVKMLAPIFIAMRAKRPNWKDIAQQLIEYMEERDPNWQRISAILDALEDGAKCYEDLAIELDMSHTVVRQTISALEHGGFEFTTETAGDTVGRPVKFVGLP